MAPSIAGFCRVRVQVTSSLHRIDQNNTDKWSGLVGMTFGLKRGIGVIAEAAFGENNHRYMASAYYHF
jgi:hypothetical protein